MCDGHDELDIYGGTILEQIVAVVGAEAAAAIVSAFGGRTLYVPKKLKESHPLIEAVGLEMAQKICDHFAFDDTGMQLLIPMGRSGSYAAGERIKAVRLFTAQGMSAAEMAARLNVHIRTVYRCRKRIKLENRSKKAGGGKP